MFCAKTPDNRKGPAKSAQAIPNAFHLGIACVAPNRSIKHSCITGSAAIAKFPLFPVVLCWSAQSSPFPSRPISSPVGSISPGRLVVHRPVQTQIYRILLGIEGLATLSRRECPAQQGRSRRCRLYP